MLDNTDSRSLRYSWLSIQRPLLITQNLFGNRRGSPELRILRTAETPDDIEKERILGPKLFIALHEFKYFRLDGTNLEFDSGNLFGTYETLDRFVVCICRQRVANHVVVVHSVRHPAAQTLARLLLRRNR